MVVIEFHPPAIWALRKTDVVALFAILASMLYDGCEPICEFFLVVGLAEGVEVDSLVDCNRSGDLPTPFVGSFQLEGQNFRTVCEDLLALLGLICITAPFTSISVDIFHQVLSDVLGKSTIADGGEAGDRQGSILLAYRILVS